MSDPNYARFDRARAAVPVASTLDPQRRFTVTPGTSTGTSDEPEVAVSVAPSQITREIEVAGEALAIARVVVQVAAKQPPCVRILATLRSPCKSFGFGLPDQGAICSCPGSSSRKRAKRPSSLLPSSLTMIIRCSPSMTAGLTPSARSKPGKPGTVTRRAGASG